MTWTDNYRVLTSLEMMAATTVVFLLLTWYLDNVLPSEYGVPRHPLFFLSPSTCAARSRNGKVSWQCCAIVALG